MTNINIATETNKERRILNEINKHYIETHHAQSVPGGVNVK